MKEILLFVILFIVFYFIYYFIFDDMLKKEKYTKISELVFLTKKFNLDKKKMNYKKCLNGVAIINSLIIAGTASIVIVLPFNMFVTFLIAFVILVVTIFTSYTIYGKFLNKKWGKNDGK